MRIRAGFTLTEVLVAIVVIAVLAGLAVPMFQGTVERSRRAEAIQRLSATRASMLRYFAQNNTYVGATFANIDYNPNANAGGQTVHFAYALGGLAAATFTITATRNAVNGGDGASTVTINQAGVVGGTGAFA